MIKQYLSQPYPQSVNKWKLNITISLFIGLFMLIFQPFGITGSNNLHKAVFCFGYGFVTFVILLIDLHLIPFFFPSLFENKRWTVLKQIIWLVFIIFSIGLGNYVYTSVLFSFWNLHYFLLFQVYTFVVGIIPIVVLTIIQQNVLLAQNFKSAQEFNSSLNRKKEARSDERVCLTADNERDRFEIELSHLLYIESTGNYIEIFYTKEEKLKSALLRSTLKRTELQLEHYPSMQKCHRAFVVNIDKITQVKSNAQGLRLTLIDTETEIPVSRNFSKDLKDRIISRV